MEIGNVGLISRNLDSPGNGIAKQEIESVHLNTLEDKVKSPPDKTPKRIITPDQLTSIATRDEKNEPEAPVKSSTFLGMTGKQWGRVGWLAFTYGLGSLAFVPFGHGGAAISQAVSGFLAVGLLGDALAIRGPFSDGINSVINLAAYTTGFFAAPLVGATYGALAATGAVFAVAGAGAAVVGSGPIGEWSPDVVRETHEYIRKEDYA